jgi:type IV pilus assembly protein PilM
MFSPKSILTLCLGAQTIGLAKFHVRSPDGLVLQKYCSRESLIDPANEKLDQAELTSLREIIAELQIKGCAVSYTVAAQSVFARFVKLPAIEEEKIERIIAFEAQQNVPFPIDEVVWDYQLIGGGAEQIRVVLVAIKSDLLDEINGAIEGSGLRTALIDVATMAIYNAFRYNYAHLTGCSLLIDLGARTTNLLFIEPQKIFSRSIPVGGSSITSAIAKEFNEPFAAAEFRKKRDGFISLGDAEPSDPEVCRVSKLIRSTMTRLHAEVMRSISHYRAQQQGNSPERVFLCGGTAGTPYIREFFREKLQIPIEFFDPLRNVGVVQSASVNEATHSARQLGELVGLALRSVSACPMALNLRPAIVVRRQDLEKRRPFLIAAAAALILSLLGWGFYYMRAAQVAREEGEKIDRIDAPMRVAEAKIENLCNQAATLNVVANPLANAINDRFFWIEILEDLNARLPKENIWITELIPLSEGKPVGVDEKHVAEISQIGEQAPPAGSTAKSQTATIDGLLLHGLYLFNPKQQEVVIEYFRNLVGSSFFNVDPNNQSRAIKSTIPNDTDWAFPYELRLDLKKPVKLP